MTKTPLTRGTLQIGDKEIEIVASVPPTGAEPLLASALEVVVAAPGGRGVLAVGPAPGPAGWIIATVADAVDAALGAADAGALTLVLRDVGGTDMAGRAHAVVMGFRSIDLPEPAVVALRRLVERYGPGSDHDPPEDLAAIRAAALH